MGLLDFIFPKKCVGCGKFGDYICTDCFIKISFETESICLVCNRQAVNGITHPGCYSKYTIDGMLASIVYRNISKRLIYAFKYKPYLADLEKMLVDFFYEGLIQKEQFHKILQKDTVLVPVPLHSKKMRERGYNQAEILAKNLGKRLGIAVSPALYKVRETRSQTSLKREDRKKNIVNAFTVNAELVTANSKFLLVDDIITSGATMLEAAKVLKRAGAKKVWGISLAHGK